MKEEEEYDDLDGREKKKRPWNLRFHILDILFLAKWAGLPDVTEV